MKKFFGLMLLFVAMILSFTSCSKDDEEAFVTAEKIVGTWDVIWAEQDGESIDIPEGYIYMTLKSDGSYKTVMFSDYYIGEYKIEGNTVIGTTVDPITEYYKFTSLAYIIHSGFISGYQNRYGDNLKPPTNVYHRMTA